MYRNYLKKSIKSESHQLERNKVSAIVPRGTENILKSRFPPENVISSVIKQWNTINTLNIVEELHWYRITAKVTKGREAIRR